MTLISTTSLGKMYLGVITMKEFSTLPRGPKPSLTIMFNDIPDTLWVGLKVLPLCQGFSLCIQSHIERAFIQFVYNRIHSYLIKNYNQMQKEH